MEGACVVYVLYMIIAKRGNAKIMLTEESMNVHAAYLSLYSLTHGTNSLCPHTTQRVSQQR